MKLQFQDQKDYPALARFLSAELPHVEKKPKIWAAFKKYAGIHGNGGWSNTARRALKWGEGPTVHVTELETFFLVGPRAGQKRIVWGMYRSAYPNRIYLDDTMIEDFEKDRALPRAKEFVESVVLHELVHWANDQMTIRHKGLHTLTPVKVRTKTGFRLEMSNHTPRNFEMEAYGRQMTTYWK